MSSSNSSSSTRERAQRLAAQVGSTHVNISIDDMVGEATSTFIQSSQQVPKFTVHGGSPAENLALQNVQSRCRMVLAYLYAQLTPWTHGEWEGLGVGGRSFPDISADLAEQQILIIRGIGGRGEGN